MHFLGSNEFLLAGSPFFIRRRATLPTRRTGDRAPTGGAGSRRVRSVRRSTRRSLGRSLGRRWVPLGHPIDGYSALFCPPSPFSGLREAATFPFTRSFPLTRSASAT